MEVFIKIVDAILFVFFLIPTPTVFLFNLPTVLPQKFFPNFLIEFYQWYIRTFDDYLFAEKPLFFVGLIWHEIIFQWPLAIASLYAIAAGKSWITFTCLIYGGCISTSIVAILAELHGSGKASKKLLLTYYPSVVFAILAIVRGLLPLSSKSTIQIM